MAYNYLDIKDLSYHFFENDVRTFSLNSINLSLPKGKLLGLIGPSGCGKSTLLRLIAGFEQPSKGSISIASKLVASKNLNVPPEKRKVGMVFQDYALFPHLNLLQNVFFGLSKKQDPSRALWLMEMLGLTELRFRYPHELSGGQKQRLALARALAPGNSFVLLDEPFSSLDIDVRYRLRSELKTVLSSCDACGILVTHDPQEALAICDQVAVMNNGEIHQCSSPNDLIDFPKTLFVGRFALHRNVLPVKLNEGKLLTPIGILPNTNESKNIKKGEFLVDEASISIEKCETGNALVDGLEFLGNSLRIRFLVDDLLIRVFHTLDNPPQKGERCNLKFKETKHGILFPGPIRINF